MIHPQTDEILESLWYSNEAGRKSVSITKLRVEGDCAAVVAELIAAKQVKQAGDDISLLPAGEERGRGIVRRHRLAEILFTHVLELDRKEAQESACEFEHILSESVVDRVCTFLGHPPNCPHGKPIPQGSCCAVYSRKLEPLITRLVDLPIGASGTVVFIAPKSPSRLNKLAAFGVVPGSLVKLIERKPSVVMSCGPTSIAIEDEIGREIFVRPIV